MNTAMCWCRVSSNSMGALAEPGRKTLTLRCTYWFHADYRGQQFRTASTNPEPDNLESLSQNLATDGDDGGGYGDHVMAVLGWVDR